MNMPFFHKLIFLLKKVIFGDKFLTSFSIDEGALLKDVEGKSVAIVGNARDLSKTTFGSSIDEYEVIIRLNDAPIPSEVSHGSRTDWMAVAKKVSETRIMARDPRIILWMPSKRKRVSLSITTYSRFYLQRIDSNLRLRKNLRAPPSLGIMVIDLLSSSSACSIGLFGFDFFSSRSLSGRRAVDQVPHDFEAERQMVEALLKSDDRFRLWPMADPR